MKAKVEPNSESKACIVELDRDANRLMQTEVTDEAGSKRPSRQLPARAMAAGCDELYWLGGATDDLETLRISAGHRIHALHRLELTVEKSVLASLKSQYLNIRIAELRSIRTLEDTMRAHPLGPWVVETKGLGLKQIGRLLGVIGDPYMRDTPTAWEANEQGELRPTASELRPRTLGQLNAYVGMHVQQIESPGAPSSPSGGSDANQSTTDTQHGVVGVAPRRQRDQLSKWNHVARKRLWLVAESTGKSRCENCRLAAAEDDDTGWRPSPSDCTCEKDGYIYRAVFDEARTHYDDAVHLAPCVRCGPSGKPAATGSLLSAGHKKARAHRAAMKAILRDLYEVSRAWHEAHTETS